MVIRRGRDESRKFHPMKYYAGIKMLLMNHLHQQEAMLHRLVCEQLVIYNNYDNACG